MSRATFVTWILLVLAGPAWAASSVGVAPFERSGVGEPPDIATMLANRLITAGVACVGPDRIGVPAVAEPDAAQVQSWSKGTSVDGIVFGRVTGIGNRYSVDLQLRSSRTGEVVSVHVTEFPKGGDPGAAVNELVSKVLEGLSVLESGGSRRTTATAAAGPAPPVAARPAPAPRRKDKGLFSGDGGPLRITSDDLEARQSGGARHMIFTNNVKATRADVNLTANRLDAFYPKGSNRPEKLVATGRVRLVRNSGEARCQKMTYIDAEQRVHCEGDSELVRDGDRARGDKIEWDLETDTIFIKGNADVLLTDAEAGSGS